MLRRARALLGAVAVLASLLVLATPSAAPAAPSDASRFVPLTPARVLDTRLGVNAPVGAIPAGGTLNLAVLGQGGVPASGVSAVVLNVTATETAGPGYITVFPTGQPGGASNLNIETPNQTIANLVVAPVGTGGQVSFYTQGGTHFVADVFGYYTQVPFSAGGRYMPVSPNRLLDTRQEAPGRLGAGGSVTVQVAGRFGVPLHGASAAVLNVTIAEANAGFVQVIPDEGAANAARFGTSSNLNAIRDGQTIPNLVMVPLGADGAVTIYSERGTHLIVDVFGYYTDDSATVSDAGLFVPVTPDRLLETRGGAKPTAGSITTTSPLGRIGIPPSGVAAILGNLTATQADPGWVQALPGKSPAGSIGKYSNVNMDHFDQTIPNAVVANLGDDGSIDLYTSASTYLLLDASGYFTAGAPPTVAVTAPSGTVSASQTLAANVTGYGILGVQFYVDGQAVGSEDTNGTDGYSAPWASNSVPNGAHNITARVRTAGASATSAPRTVTVRNALVTLTFDDGTDNQLYAAQELAGRHMPGTFYLLGDYLDDRALGGDRWVAPPQGGYLTVAQAQEIRGLGHEIGSHTMDHCSLTSTTDTQCVHPDNTPWVAPLSPTEVQAQLEASKTKLDGWGLGPINNFASPYGDMNATVLQQVKDAGYKSHRGVEDAADNGLNWPGSDPWDLRVKNVFGKDGAGGEVSHTLTDGTTIDAWLSDVMTAQANPATSGTMWMILLFHEISDAPHFGDDYNMTPERFRDALTRIQHAGVRVVTVQQALQETGRL